MFPMIGINNNCPCNWIERIRELNGLVRDTIERMGWPATYKFMEEVSYIEIGVMEMPLGYSRIRVTTKAPMDRYIEIGVLDLTSNVQRDWIICHELTHAYTTPYFRTWKRQPQVEDYADFIASSIVDYDRCSLVLDSLRIKGENKHAFGY